MDDVQCADENITVHTFYRIVRDAYTWYTLWIDFDTLEKEYM